MENEEEHLLNEHCHANRALWHTSSMAAKHHPPRAQGSPNTSSISRSPITIDVWEGFMETCKRDANKALDIGDATNDKVGLWQEEHKDNRIDLD